MIYEKMVFYMISILALAGYDIYFAREGLLPGGSLISVFILITLLFSYLISIPNYFKSISRPTLFVFIVFLLFVFWAIISGLLGDVGSSNWYEAPFRYLIYFLFSFCFVYALNLSSLRSNKPFLVSSLGIAFLAFSIPLILDFIYPGTFRSGGSRPTSVVPNANGTGQVLTVIGLLFAMSIKSKRLMYSIMILTSVLVFLTLSRSSILLLLISWIVIFSHRKECFSESISRNFLVITPVLFIIFFLSVLALVSSNMSIVYSKRLDSIVYGDALLDTEDSRVALAATYFDKWLSSPLIGYGTNSTVDGGLGILGATHNIYLKVLVENGLVGLIIFLIFYTVLFLRNFKRNIITPAYMVLLVLMWGLFTNTLLDSRVFFIFLGFVWYYQDIFNSSDVKQV